MPKPFLVWFLFENVLERILDCLKSTIAPIEEQSSQGIISDVNSDIPVRVGHVHYLPHYPVVREDKQTTKVVV